MDTNVFSELAKPRPSPAVVEWFRARRDAELHLSVLSFGELLRGVRLLAPGKRRDALAAWVEDGVRERFADRLLPVSASIVDAWASLSARAARDGIALGVVDGYLAATAEVHGLALVTRDHEHLERLGVRYVDPFG